MQTTSGIGSAYRLDHGLTGITTGGPGADLDMPANRSMAPAQQLTESVLAQLLQGNSLDSLLDELIRPQVEDRSVLLPGVFRDTLAHVPGSLEREAAARPAGSDDARILMRACRQLTAFQEDVKLAGMYQGALVPG
jgi:hypothetical protein